MGAIYYKICIDSYEIYLLECFTSPLNQITSKCISVKNYYMYINKYATSFYYYLP